MNIRSSHSRFRTGFLAVCICMLICLIGSIAVPRAIYAQIDSQSNTNRVDVASPPPSAPAAAPAGEGQTTNQPMGEGQTSNTPQTFTLRNPLKVDSVGALVQTGVEIFTYLVIIVAVLMFVWVGFQYILARGNADRMKELSGWLTYIAIGVAVVIGARILVGIIINTLGATGAVDQSVIRSADNALRGR